MNDKNKLIILKKTPDFTDFPELVKYLERRCIKFENTSLFAGIITFEPSRSNNMSCLIAECNGVVQCLLPNGKKYFETGCSLSGKMWVHGTLFDPNKPTYITESIFNALSLIQAGYNAVCIYSASYTSYDFYSSFAKNTEIILAFDNDKAGLDAIKKHLKYLRNNEYTNTKIAIPTKDDWNTMIKNKINLTDNEVMNDCKNKGNEFMKTVKFANNQESECPEPEDIFKKPALSPLAPSDTECLPDCFRRVVEDYAHRMQAPAEYIANPLVITHSALVASKLSICPREYDDTWVVSPNQWGVILGSPSVLKSPCFKIALKPYTILQELADEQFKKDLEDYKCYEAVFEEEKKIVTEDFRKELKKTKNDDEKVRAREKYKVFLATKEPEPKRKRYFVTVTTPQQLQVIQEENEGRSILLFRDELGGFLHHLDQAGNESEKAYYMEGWAGDGSHVNDTISRGSTIVKRNNIAILGTCQPSAFCFFFA